VLQEIGSASGIALYKASGTSSYQDFFDGILYGESSGRFNEVLVAKEGEDQVYHYNSKQQFTYSDETCTYQESFTYVNGEVRHNAYNFQCTPTP
jgi:hypothetical protein